jgi:hypothetical protein
MVILIVTSLLAPVISRAAVPPTRISFTLTLDARNPCSYTLFNPTALPATTQHAFYPIAGGVAAFILAPSPMAPGSLLNVYIPAYQALPDGTYTVVVFADQAITLSSINCLSTLPPPPTTTPTISAGGPYTVNEGGTVTLTATGSDGAGHSYQWDAYSWDLNNDGIFETSGQIVTFSAMGLDGPSTRTIVVRGSDSTGRSATSQAIVNVVNVAPTVSATFASSTVSCGANNATLNVTISDPGPDTNTAKIDWGDGSGLQDLGSVFSSFSVPHTYGRAGSYVATVTVVDDDGGSGTASFTTTVNYTVVGGGIQPPIKQDGTSVFKFGSTIPTKVKVVDCDGSGPADLAPTVQLTLLDAGAPVLNISEPVSTSAADTTGVMRFSTTDSQYIYNLASAPLPDSSATYQVTITIPFTGQRISAQFGLRP